MKLDDPIGIVKGVGKKREMAFKSQHIETIEDLLYYFPRKYEYRQEVDSFESLGQGEKAILLLKLQGVLPVKRKGRLQILTYEVEDQHGIEGRITFFNQLYLKKSLKIGQWYRFYGTVEYFNRYKTLTNPEILWKPSNHEEIKVIYPQKMGLSSELISKYISELPLSYMEIGDNLPMVLREHYQLMDRKKALLEIHRPSSLSHLEEAKKRLVFEEFFYQQLAIFYFHSMNETRGSGLLYEEKRELKDFENHLPFTLTQGQMKVWNEIQKDLYSNKILHRLIQGDVGSGKTIIGILSLYLTVLNGYQGALMAPTEILASQHYESFVELLHNRDVKIELLTGSVKEKNKRKIVDKVASGEIDILIGTHALIEEDVVFHRLGMTITDEQHRFGVRQRELLREKGSNIHTLVMSATPIPRTLALTVYGDLDVSVIDTLPPGRQKVETIPLDQNQLPHAFDYIRQQLRDGRQAYFVCPLIEENDKLDLDPVMTIYEELSTHYLKDFSIGLLHGKMKNEEKDDIIQRFHRNECQALVSTTVIEVGVNVPNANVMFVYNAQRFGLAQLHQLRGRVGRGQYKSTCFLYNTGNSEISRERLRILQKSQDGFYIAQKDLELRGAGDFFGTRQHGFMDLKIADPVRHQDIFHWAQLEARRFHRRFSWKNLGDNPVREKLLKMFAFQER